MWPFRKAPPPAPRQPRDERQASEDWTAGDIAECISDTWEAINPYSPKRGDVLRVSEVVEGLSAQGHSMLLALRFAGKPQALGWDNRSFRKVRPADDAEFIARVKACRPRAPARERVS